ncbi:MAG TPA: ElyC/SanA/YdcF family protein [Actinospica sp.]|nr:ElyC/SanA/YdcF family protein [Actinospica sp.]
MTKLRGALGRLARRFSWFDFRTRAGQRRSFQVVAIATVLVFVPIIFVRAQGDPYVYSAEQVPVEPVGIVFGAEVVGDQPGSYLQGRLDLALSLWHAGKFKVFLVTGDNSSPTYNEPKAMRDYLVAHGVPESVIVLDYAGFDTWQSCDRAKQVFGVDHAIAISQSFHVPRAVYLCRAAGITTYGVGDPSGLNEGNAAEWAWNNLRELGSSFHAVYQAGFHPAPTFLGPQDDDVSRALAAASAISVR